MRPQPTPDPHATATLRLLGYWRAHPLAADTLQGICEWWLADASVPIQEIEAALAHLVAIGLVDARQAADGKVRYRLRAPNTGPEGEPFG